MVCINTSQVYLHFGDRHAVCFEGGIATFRDGNLRFSEMMTSVANHVPLDLFSLLECPIKAVRITNSTLMLEFEGGVQLSSHERGHYETASVTIGDQVIRY
jgi:hypothetical protein